MSPIAYLNSLGMLSKKTLLAHCVHVDAEDISIIAETGAAVLHCPGSNLKLGSGIAPNMEHVIKKAFVLQLERDGAASNNDLNMIEEMRLAAFLQKGIMKDAAVLPAALAFDMANLTWGASIGL